MKRRYQHVTDAHRQEIAEQINGNLEGRTMRRTRPCGHSSCLFVLVRRVALGAIRTASTTMRYVRPSATFIENAYRNAVSTALTALQHDTGKE
jgi:hypothetical protein